MALQTHIAPAQAPPPLPTGFLRISSTVEFAADAFFVLAHDVFHILPNEVPILCVLGLVSYRLRNGEWAAAGLVRPAPWTRIVLIGAAAAVARMVIGEAVGALTAGWGPAVATPEDFSAIRGKALVLTSVLFGVGHAYKGPAGMIDSGVGGLVFGTAFLLSGRNLWAAVLAHGFVDTTGVCLLCFGLAS